MLEDSEEREEDKEEEIDYFGSNQEENLDAAKGYHVLDEGDLQDDDDDLTEEEKDNMLADFKKELAEEEGDYGHTIEDDDKL